MKTKNLLLYGIVAFAFLATSCGKDDDPKADELKIVNPITTSDTVFATVTVEESKTYIEDQGLTMLDDMKAMENEPAIQTNISLVKHLDTSEPFKSNGNNVHISNSVAFAPVYATANYKQTGAKGILKSIQVNPADGPETIQEAFDELVGIYEWNSTNQEWDYNATGDNIVLLFPSEENGTSNNASYTVSYKGYTGPNPIEADYTGDLPQNVSAKLVVDGNEISSFLVDIVYNSDGYPTSIETSLSLGDFKWSAMASNTDNKAFKTVLAFTKGGDILLQFALDASGNWTKDNIDANYTETTKYYYSYWDETTWSWVEIEVGENDEWNSSYTNSEFDIHKVVTGGNASFQVMNLKLAGSIDAEKFGNKIKEIESTYNEGTQGEEYANAYIKAINDYISLTLRYADNNLIIAMVEAYPITEENTYTNYVYNELTGNWDAIETTETNYNLGLRFVFVDGSKVDAETYFTSSFTDLTDSFQEWANELEDSYGK